MVEDPAAATIVASTIELPGRLGMRVVAEGVEAVAAVDCCARLVFSLHRATTSASRSFHTSSSNRWAREARKRIVDDGEHP